MAELQRKKQKSVGTVCKDAIMTGISYMIPVIVGGGVITAIAKMMGGYNIGDTAAEMQTLAQVIFTIGNNLFAFAVPCLAAFIAYAIADKPGIAPGYAMGVLAGLMKDWKDNSRCSRVSWIHGKSYPCSNAERGSLHGNGRKQTGRC